MEKKMKKNVPETPIRIQETPTLRPFFIQEIFLRLPVKSLLRLKSLNKYYYNLISSQRFQKLYLDHKISKIYTNPSIILHDYKRLDRCDRDFRHLPHCASSTIIQCNGGQLEDQTDYTFIPAHGYQMYSLCSCNGLVLMCAAAIYVDGRSKEKLCIANPATKEYKTIGTGSEEVSYSLYGLGYVSRNDEYKVVRVRKVEMWMDSFEAEIYTLGGSSDEWKGIGSINYKFEDHHGVLFNGLLHWVADRWEKGDLGPRRGGEVMVAFDFVSEQFLEVALPQDPLETREERAVMVRTVGESGGCLCVVSLIDRKRIDVWVMQEYGVKESWSKSFTFSINVKNTREFGLSWTQNRPVARLIRSFKNNNNVLLQVDTSLILYDSEKKRIRQLKIGGNEEWTDAEVYVPSLFSLNSLANSEAQRPNKRQQFNSGARFIWQRPNKRESLRGCRVENYRAKLEEICQGRLEDDPVLAV